MDFVEPLQNIVLPLKVANPNSEIVNVVMNLVYVLLVTVVIEKSIVEHQMLIVLLIVDVNPNLENVNVVKIMVPVKMINVVVKTDTVESQKNFVIVLKVVNLNLEIVDVAKDLVHVLLANVVVKMVIVVKRMTFVLLLKDVNWNMENVHHLVFILLVIPLLKVVMEIMEKLLAGVDSLVTILPLQFITMLYLIEVQDLSSEKVDGMPLLMMLKKVTMS